MNVSEQHVISIFSVKEYAMQEANMKQVAAHILQLTTILDPALTHKLVLLLHGTYLMRFLATTEHA
jgi:hypothetical protein